MEKTPKYSLIPNERGPSGYGEKVTLIDWDVAVNTGVRLVRPGPNISLAEARQAVAQLRELSVIAQTHVRDFTGLTSLEPAGPATIVDRIKSKRALSEKVL